MHTLVAYAASDNLGGAVSSCPGVGGITNLTDLINFFTCTIVKAIVPLLVALAVMSFVYGLIQYFLYPDNEEKRKQGKSFMLWGLIALFVMTSIWAIVRVFSATFFSSGTTGIPTLPTGSN